MPQTITFEVTCPHCKKSLMDPYHQIHSYPSILVNIEAKSGKGNLRLCSIYGCFDHKTDVKLEKGEVVKFFCPSCGESLLSNVNCEECNAPMVNFRLAMGGKVYICAKYGCTNHSVSFVDLTAALDELYHKYGYGTN